MKKILLGITTLLLFCVLSFAQDKKAEKNKVEKTSEGKTATEAKKSVASVPTKKDGSPDMRYKENKDAAKAAPTGPVKKDGTPDMRYKENKDAQKKEAPKKKG